MAVTSEWQLVPLAEGPKEEEMTWHLEGFLWHSIL